VSRLPPPPPPADSLHISKPTWWLESRFHFSFADYYDNARLNFGALRVLNDDVVQGKAGFGTHPHRDAEIFSYVVDGHLSHQASSSTAGWGRHGGMACQQGRCGTTAASGKPQAQE